MKLAINYSPAAAKLAEAKKIEVDLFKCPDWPDLVAQVGERWPCYVHFSFAAGKGLMNSQVDWQQVDSFLDTTDTEHLNIHLSPSILDFADLELTSRRAVDRKRLIDAMLRDIGELTSRYDPEDIVLENTMWEPVEPTLVPELALLPEVLSEVISETQCRLCLDLAHASITARHFGVDVADYVSGLPMDRLGELHITGTTQGANGLWVDHNPLRDEEWHLVEWAMERISGGDWAMPAIVAFEYGGIGSLYEHRSDQAVMLCQMPRLKQLFDMACV